ncbi:uncharacterized protein B0J16DRAFT_163200 [Fusarium flagelliforme]|uniref:uncharacterized protein n=1 Tax=Fusarium flagelliforme TaxID=2675880 RepID=UPI001E8E7E63|nr:uncharacterized protein B0J16DRAFT_163200 [Fusarium flagelliforme]KAH7183259.1 hypothetical protein B0J16DRAFT_163200 [Fusarium flagelliforme]
MRSQACEPCAKRKVRCDRSEPPCSNCKRRKNDTCTYPEVSPFERIKKLEEIVRSLGGDPDNGERPSGTPSLGGSHAQTPVIVQQDGKGVYQESEGWQTWIDVSRLYKGSKPQFSSNDPRGTALSPAKFLPHAFNGSPWRDNTQISETLPLQMPALEAVKLWDTFMERVEPVVKINFKWTLAHLKAAVANEEKWNALDDGERALILSTRLFAAVTLTNKECLKRFGRARALLMNECRMRCDIAFSGMNLLAIDSIATLKAFCFYIKANIDVLSSRSLSSLIGLISRSAEQLGIHRDGTVLGLSPIETEERRRLWWQLQHLELILSLKNGVTPLSFGTAWDVRLPLNIEDEDLDPSSKFAPKERTGLTSFAYTCFTYFIMEKQRGFRRFAQAKQIAAGEGSLLGCLSPAMVDGMESSLNEHFLQYCDPINPLHTLLQISARAVVNILRLRKYHDAKLQSDRGDEKANIDHFNACMQAMRYQVVSYANPLLHKFRWLAEASFVWYALIGILVDMSSLTDVTMIQSAWSLLSELYAVADQLTDMPEDRRTSHAAKSVIATWYECRQKPGLTDMEKPEFVSQLEEILTETEGNVIEYTNDKDAPMSSLLEFGLGRAGEDDLQPFGFEFADIDWAFWDSIS